jgi:hypothetical protein
VSILSFAHPPEQTLSLVQMVILGFYTMQWTLYFLTYCLKVHGDWIGPGGCWSELVGYVVRFEGIWQSQLKEREKWIGWELTILGMALFGASTSDRCENSVTSGRWQMEAVHSSEMSETMKSSTWCKDVTDAPHLNNNCCENITAYIHRCLLQRLILHEGCRWTFVLVTWCRWTASDVL